jgi:hypothetical protein
VERAGADGRHVDVLGVGMAGGVEELPGVLVVDANTVELERLGVRGEVAQVVDEHPPQPRPVGEDELAVVPVVPEAMTAATHP